MCQGYELYKFQKQSRKKTEEEEEKKHVYFQIDKSETLFVGFWSFRIYINLGSHLRQEPRKIKEMNGKYVFDKLLVNSEITME